MLAEIATQIYILLDAKSNQINDIEKFLNIQIEIAKGEQFRRFKNNLVTKALQMF